MNSKKYILLNQNIEVLDFGFDEELNIITEIYNIYNIDYAPYKLKCDYEQTSSIDRVLMNHWFSGRGIPVHRDNSKEIIEQFNIDSTKELINKHFALSLSDQYWIKPYDLPIKWEDINYFDNTYDAINFANATFGENASSSIKGLTNETSDKFKTPNNTTDGQLKKVWLKVNNKNCLFKASGSLYNFEPINEVIASKICKILDVPYVPYSLDVIHSKRQDSLVSICECAINKDEEIITAYSILPKENLTAGSNDNYNTYLDILNNHNVPNAEEYLQKMLMLDYILLNEDRHLNNFGIIRNVKTLEWVSICPIFDTGRSMNTTVTTSYWNFKLGEVKCFTSNLIPSESLIDFFTINITSKQIEELKKLSLEYSELLQKYKQYTNLTDEQLKILSDGLKERFDCFESAIKLKKLII
ncbi:MAG: hypothetical protein Q4G09_07810 [Clostridia bacterium]|nr:hypothetical protein [Clostridia bacterium]